MCSQKALAGRLPTLTATTSQRHSRYEALRLGVVGTQRYIKIRADANLYLPALSAPQFRAMFRHSKGRSKGVLRKCLSRMTGNCHVRF